MLTLIIPTFSLLILPKVSQLFWHMLAPALIMLLMLFSMFTPNYNSFFSVSVFYSLDQLSIMLIILTLWVVSLMFQASISILSSTNKPKSFAICNIMLLLVLVMCFSSSNLLLFYVWFEASLVPTMILIMLWGYQPERIQASMYLMIYTVTASLPLLVVICCIYFNSKHLLMVYPWMNMSSHSAIMAIILVLAFMVKLPLFLVHLWLPKAHVEAPVAGSMILAAILLKLGGYGLLRVLILFPNTLKLLSHPLMSIALIGGVATSLICLRQPDMKSIIAYSSVGHMGLMCIGTMTNSTIGLLGAFTMMVAHAFSSSALFCICNIMYEFTHTRNLALIKGFLSIAPLMSMLWFMLICINMAAPPSINLLSEILLISASVSYSLVTIIPIALISFLTVAYSLFIYSSINHGHPLINANVMGPLKPNYMVLILLHLCPAVLLIMCPSLISFWF